jgi:hypothetical protein
MSKHIVSGLVLSLVAIVGGLSVGCSSGANDPFGPDPDYRALEAQLRNPTGTFRSENAGSVFSKTSGQIQAQQTNDLAGAGSVTGTSVGASSSTSTKSLDLLDTVVNGSNKVVCTSIQQGNLTGSCTCPSGGSFDYDYTGLEAARGYKGGPLDVSLKVRLNGCASGGVTVDGKEFVNMHVDATQTTTASGKTTTTLNDMRLLLDAHLTAATAKESHKVDFTFLYENGKMWMSIAVDDGNVVIGTSGGWDGRNGSIVIRDKNESWTCVLSNGAGKCTSDKGATRDVKS